MACEILPEGIRVYGEDIHTHIRNIPSFYMECMDDEAILSKLTLDSAEEYVIIFPGCGYAKSETMLLQKIVEKYRVHTAIFLDRDISYMTLDSVRDFLTWQRKSTSQDTRCFVMFRYRSLLNCLKHFGDLKLLYIGIHDAVRFQDGDDDMAAFEEFVGECRNLYLQGRISRRMNFQQTDGQELYFSKEIPSFKKGYRMWMHEDEWDVGLMRVNSKSTAAQKTGTPSGSVLIHGYR